MNTHNNQALWLESCHSNGVQLNLKELMYYRAKAKLLDLKPKAHIKHKLAGQYLAPHKGRGMEFAEVRHYQQGDDIRSIDWRVTARTGQTHTKLYQEEKERPVFIFSDFSQSMLFGTQFLLKSMQVAHLSALIAWSAVLRGDRVGGLVFNQQQHFELKPGSRQSAVMALFHNLLSCHKQALTLPVQPTNHGFAENLKRLTQLAKPGSLIYLISDFTQLDDEVIKQLQLLARHCEIIACQVNDPFELQLADYSDNIKVQTGDQIFELPLANKQFRTRFCEHANQQQTKRHNALKKSGIATLHFSAASPLEQQILGKA
ncbi:DUF58 domain-containing protein [Pseudoalteromonas tunicata]|jgi:uncharacterized protein (DUF58 family)|uniref:DUF58 domain-containing protein n=1 Tax=Pseudoalteromonas tunicata D2 TaxID=87626 RepID=A4C685_9GAMM|nr:DUF58 domain-containing protein [Pseudoalteromonas tunicata]ATC95463.1 hypothetical protein PTUN_a3075 [Pseudoalteromonas tunicata]EAR29489.1 hypothetical protein PTD2_11754 [Pseudoalteromonas tunicata D2]